MRLLSRTKKLVESSWHNRLTELAVSRFAHDMSASLSGVGMGLETLESPSLPPAERDLALKISRQAIRTATARLSLWRLAFSLTQAETKPAQDVMMLFEQFVAALQVEGKMTIKAESLTLPMVRLVTKVVLAFSLTMAQKACKFSMQVQQELVKVTIEGERVVLPAEYTLCLSEITPGVSLDQRSAFFLLLRDQLESMGYFADVIQVTPERFEIHFLPA